MEAKPGGDRRRKGVGPPPLDPRFSAGWRTGAGTLPLDRPLVMGILNLTPDSFSDGGELDSLDDALRRAERHVEEGADLLDVGGESTRPGAEPVPVDEESRRILPFLEAAAERFPVPLSVDTRKAEVARRAVDAGAAVVNDVSGLRHDPAMAGVVARTGVGVVVMHMRGEPRTMQDRTDYGDVVAEVRAELVERVREAEAAGIESDRIVVDPGIGFAKTADQNLVLLRGLGELAGLGYPVLVGPSRKSFIGKVLDAPTSERLEGTLAACALALGRGARIFRVHDVGPVRRALAVSHAIEG